MFTNPSLLSFLVLVMLNHIRIMSQPMSPVKSFIIIVQAVFSKFSFSLILPST